jgi:hypothetical protein
MEWNMARNKQRSSLPSGPGIPDHPIISTTLHRDTLDRVVHVIDLLQQLDLSEGLTPNARAGLYWIHHMLADTVKHVSNHLRDKPANQHARAARRVPRSRVG